MGKKIDLIACPHCGGEKLRIDDSGVFGNGPEEKPESFWVVCLNCYATGGPGKDKAEAAANWNKRVNELAETI
jgi:Lar family restriction alleviation protein